jgi:cell division protein FtsI (penicillin-binding protein 3)
MMEGVVLHGTGTKGRLPGYTSGGKTGSAQMFDFKTLKYTHRYNASFAGFAPVNRPAVVVVVNLHGTKEFGGIVAAPVFRDVASTALRVMSTPRDLPDLAPSAPVPARMNDLAIAGAAVPPQAPEMPAESVVLIGEPGPQVELIGPRVPDFRGKSVRTVMAESMALGMQVEVLGSGVARSQNPPAGSVISLGERVRVQFAR